MMRYLRTMLLAALLPLVLAAGATAAAPMEPFVPPRTATEPIDPEIDCKKYGWASNETGLVYDRSVWYVAEKTTRDLTAGYWTRETYNEHGDIIRTEMSSGEVYEFQYRYTADGALLSDGNGSCAYDEQGRLIDYTYFEEDRSSDEMIRYHFTYRYGTDTEGRTYGEKIDADTGLVQLRTTFDAQERPIRTDYLDENGIVRKQTCCTYDAAGRITMRVTSGVASYTWRYDDEGRLIAWTYATPSGETDSSIRYVYDAGGRLLGAYYGESTTPHTAYRYDAQGRLISWSGVGGSCQCTYDEKGQLLRVVFDSGSWNEFSYDDEGRTASVRSEYTEVTYRYARRGSFPDVAESAWYAPYVQSMADKGLLKGQEDGTFAPDASMTYAEAIALAVRMAADEGQSFRQGSPWYQVYVDQAKARGLPWDHADYSASITRTEFARLFAAVYRSSETMQETVQPMNTVPDGSIPDVAMTDANAADIYLLYRLGVLSGSDEAHSFRPDSEIQRSEVAAIACRLLDEGRQSFTMP